jgi:hypothetical protein
MAKTRGLELLIDVANLEGSKNRRSISSVWHDLVQMSYWNRIQSAPEGETVLEIPDRWRVVKRLAWISLGGLLVIAAGVAVELGRNIANQPPLVAGISGNQDEASVYLGNRFAAQFPPGTPSGTIFDELAKQGFHADWSTTERVKVAYVEVSAIACLNTYRVTWTVDDSGKLQQSSGQVHYDCY